MEAITLFVIALLVWKVVELNKKIENLEISTRYQLEGVAALLAKLQPKQEPKIPVRLSEEVVKEVLPVLSEEELEQELKKLRYDRYMRENKAAANKK
jgi:hypothetical protein